MPTWNSRRANPRKVWNYWGNAPDMGPSEALRDSRYENLVSVTSQTEGGDPTLPPEIGHVWPMRDGSEYIFAICSDAVAEGEIVELDTVAFDNITSGTADLLSVTKTSAGLTVNAYVGYMAYVTATGTNEGFARYIVENTADTLFFEDPFPTTFAANDDFILYHPGRVKKHTASKVIPVAGVAIEAVSAGRLGIFQVRGRCPRVVNDANAITAGLHLTPSDATAGSCEPAVAADVAGIFATALLASDASEGVPAILWGIV